MCAFKPPHAHCRPAYLVLILKFLSSLANEGIVVSKFRRDDPSSPRDNAGPAAVSKSGLAASSPGADAFSGSGLSGTSQSATSSLAMEFPNAHVPFLAQNGGAAAIGGVLGATAPSSAAAATAASEDAVVAADTQTQVDQGTSTQRRPHRSQKSLEQVISEDPRATVTISTLPNFFSRSDESKEISLIGAYFLMSQLESQEGEGDVTSSSHHDTIKIAQQNAVSWFTSKKCTFVRRTPNGTDFKLTIPTMSQVEVLDLVLSASRHSHPNTYTRKLYALARSDLSSDAAIVGRATRLLNLYCRYLQERPALPRFESYLLLGAMGIPAGRAQDPFGSDVDGFVNDSEFVRFALQVSHTLTNDQFDHAMAAAEDQLPILRQHSAPRLARLTRLFLHLDTKVEEQLPLREAARAVEVIAGGFENLPDGVPPAWTQQDPETKLTLKQFVDLCLDSLKTISDSKFTEGFLRCFRTKPSH